ncbi:hypothetical protein, partial [Moraxella catarrhalis]|uniref:hypothetical protein n=1 Tax=Moraxella catarrhalis TaxID=480 RepID=UPI001EEE85A2
KKTSQELIDATNRHEATQEFESTLKDIKKQMAIMGSQDPLAEFLYDLQNAEKYAYYTTEQLATLKDEMIKLQNAKDALNAKQAFDTLMKDTALANETPAQRLQRE